MTLGLPMQQSAAAVSTLSIARGLGYLLVAGAAVGLLWYLRTYVRRLLVEPYRTQWRYLAVGIGAAAVYGVAGLAELAGLTAAVPFRRGATLFVFLFAAVGVRAVNRSVGGTPLLPDRTISRVGPVVIALFVLGWWAAYLAAGPAAVAGVELLGLLVATAFTLYHAAGTVRAEEGTSIAAFTRQFVPALLAMALVAAAEHVGVFAPEAVPIGAAVALVGTVLAGAFLFTTAVAIRQQTGEVSRMYDPTTWRVDRLDAPDASRDERPEAPSDPGR